MRIGLTSLAGLLLLAWAGVTAAQQVTAWVTTSDTPVPRGSQAFPIEVRAVQTGALKELWVAPRFLEQRLATSASFGHPDQALAAPVIFTSASGTPQVFGPPLTCKVRDSHYLGCGQAVVSAGLEMFTQAAPAVRP